MTLQKINYDVILAT